MNPPYGLESVSTESLIDSMTALLPNHDFNKILDPCCGSGKLISVVSKQVSSDKAIGADIVSDVIESAASSYPDIDFIHADTTRELDLAADFDLVIGALPLGVRCDRLRIAPGVVTTSTSDAIIHRSLMKLKPGGIGIFLSSHNLLFGFGSKNLTNALSSEGINPIGLFHINNPLGKRSSIPGVIIIFKRSEKILPVVGKAPLGKESSLPDLLDMIYSNGEDIEGYQRYSFDKIASFKSDGSPIFTDNQSNMKNLKLGLNIIGLDIYEFDDVVLSSSQTKPQFNKQGNFDRLPHKENSIYVPKASGRTEVSQDNLPPRLKNYYQLVLDPLIAKDVYVMDTMNSEIGKKIREICSSGHVIPQINKKGLKRMLFPLHPIEEQEEWVEVSLRIKEIEKDLEQLKKHRDDRKDISEILEILERNNADVDSIETLLLSHESQTLEFKASIWTQYKPVSYELVEQQNKKKLNLQDGIVKTIAAFLNTDGGNLIIGVKDKDRSMSKKSAEVIGIEGDFKWLSKKRRDVEGYTHALIQLLNDAFGDESTVANYLQISFHELQDGTICRIIVEPLPRVEHGEMWIKTKTMGDEEFFYRVSDTTTHASAKSANRYIMHHFRNSISED